MRSLLNTKLILAAFVCLVSGTGSQSAAAPNILWITAEDMSATLGCYGDRYAITPNLDQFARQSVRYTRAFATAPICSPARSCLITGCYAPSLGTQHLRSAFPIPSTIGGFPARLRERGYYTSNNVKTDYNTANARDIIAASWNESSNSAHWRKRKHPGQPFFSVFNSMTTHQSRSMAWPREQFVKEVQSRLTSSEIHDPAQAPVPPYYPDTPVIRRTIARFYDCVTAMDKEVGAILKQLEDDGLADDTIVLFYSDHGSGMPRHKRVLLDSGMHVPLLIRFPKKYQHLAPAQPGQTVDRLVSFVDFAPTVLSLAGVQIPDHMQGDAFLGPRAAPPRHEVYGHRDRVDEAFDLARSIRTERYLYIRNYMPHLSYNQPSAWPDQGEINHEFYRLADQGTMTGPPWHFAGPDRPVEELYDCESDPQNLRNLAGSRQHKEILDQMRHAHRRHIRTSRDVGFLPESEARKLSAGTTLWAAARDGSLDLEPLFDAAGLVGAADEKSLLLTMAGHSAGVRYWGAVGLAALESISENAGHLLEAALNDDSMAVRIEAANALARHGGLEKALPVLTESLRHRDLAVVLHAARSIELLGAKARDAIPAMRQVAVRAEKIRPSETVPATVEQSADQDLAMFISFTANAFLGRVK